MIQNSYDSTADTLRHIAEVRNRLEVFVVEMLRRGRVHDASKFTPEEKPAFDEAIPAIKGLAYGSPAYNEIVARVRPALAVHYSRNSHHPEFYGERGIAGMDLFDLVEMLCDWMAAAQRNPAEGSVKGKAFFCEQKETKKLCLFVAKLAGEGDDVGSTAERVNHASVHFVRPSAACACGVRASGCR